MRDQGASRLLPRRSLTVFCRGDCRRAVWLLGAQALKVAIRHSGKAVLSVQSNIYVRGIRNPMSLLDLVAADPKAQQLYARKLQEDALDALGGSWSSKSRAALGALAESWNSDVADSTQVVDAFLRELQSESLLDQIARGRPAGL